MIRILFICHGNICRSAAAEMVLQKIVKEQGMENLFRIESAATSREEIGNDIYPPMKSALQRRSYPCLAHAARQTVRNDYSRWDYLIGMDHENIRNMRRIYDGDPDGKISMLMDWAGEPGREIDDPWYTRDFSGTLTQIEKGCEGLLRACRGRRQEYRGTKNRTSLQPYADLHCDTLYAAWRKGVEDIFQMDGAMADVSKNARGGCRLQLYAIFMPPTEEKQEFSHPYPGDDAYIEALHHIFLRTAQKHSDVFASAGNMRDVERNAAEGKVSGMLSMEEGRAVRGSFDRIRTFYEMGIRVMGLTWNHANCFGYPNSADAKEMQKGLTAFGKEAISCMEEIGMLIDVSHLSDGGFWDVVKLSKRPFIASHSNCRALNPHPRSMTDEMIRALADRGGLIGLNFYPHFLTQDPEERKSTIDDLARQLRHRIQVGGLGCAAIGTDFDGISGELEIGSADRMPDFFDALAQRGFTSHELEQICWRNVERVFRDVIGSPLSLRE